MKPISLANKKKTISEKEGTPQSSSEGEWVIATIQNSPQEVGLIKPEDTAMHPFTVVAIGASAGGLEAVTQLLKNLSPNTGMAYIYVQHLSPDHKSLLTPILSKVTEMKVQDIDDMEKMKPDNVYTLNRVKTHILFE